MTIPISYIEMPSSDLAATKQFYGQVFGWVFKDYGPAYCTVTNADVNGGFYHSEQAMQTANGAALVVLYADDLAAVQEKITAAGGHIVVETFGFPGGRRFHFTDPCGNELAVWGKDDSSA